MSITEVVLEHIESSYMLMNFRYWKCLYINDNVLKTNGTSKIEFVELQRPRIFYDEINMNVIRIYKRTVILIDRTKYLPEYFYFLTYEGSHLKSCKQMSIYESYKQSQPAFSEFIETMMVSPYDYKIIPELGKMVISSGTIMFVIDLRTFVVVQALSTSVVGKFKLLNWFPYSKNRKDIIMVLQYVFKKYVLRFSLVHGFSLKEQAMDFVINNFSTEKFFKYNLPQSLLQEILNKKIY